MSGSADRSRAAEASEWFTVMTRPSIAPEELEAFRAWRRDPDNAAAFSRVKAGWTAAGGLAERPDVAAATAAALAKYPPRRGFVREPRRFLLSPLAVGLSALALLVGLAVVALAVANSGWLGGLSTEVGGQRREVLADGSRVMLNTDSAVRVAARYATRT